MPRLTIPDEATYEVFNPVSPQTVFPIGFSLFAKADLRVSVEGVELTQSDFTFSGTLLDGGGYDGGNVTLNQGVSGAEVTIWRDVKTVRASNYAPANAATVASIDQALNRLTAMAQDMKRDLARAILAELGDTVPNAQAVIDAATVISGALFKNQLATTSGLQQGLRLSQAGSGNLPTPTGDQPFGFDYNPIRIVDTINGPTDQSYSVHGVGLQLKTGGANVRGTRTALYSEVVLTTASAADNPQRFYSGIGGVARARAADGGGSGSEKGAFFGGYFAALVDPNVTFLANVTAVEINVSLPTGASASVKTGIQIVPLPGDVVQGSGVDSAICLSRNVGSVGWRDAMLFTDASGQQPMNANGSIIRASYSGGAVTITNGIDLRGFNFSGVAFASPNFQVSATGRITTNRVTSNSGQPLELVGSSNVVRVQMPEVAFDIQSQTGPTDAKTLRMSQSASTGEFILYALNDAANAAYPFLTLKRTGATPTAIEAAVPLRLANYTAATLPAAGTIGRTAVVTDANATTFAAIVTGGGSNKVPVYDDGTNWRIG